MTITNTTTYQELKSIQKGDFVIYTLGQYISDYVERVDYQFETLGCENFHQFIIHFMGGKVGFLRVEA